MPAVFIDFGLDFLGFLASHRTPWLDLFFLAVTDLGSTVGYLVMLPLLWWGLSWKLAARLFVAIVLSVYVNALLKDTFALDRPFLQAEIVPLRTPDTFSFPSGHAQHALVFWSLLALHVRERWFSAVAAILVLLIGFSRLYLGVHFPSDVAGGFLVGALLALAYARWSGPVAARAAAFDLPTQLGLALGVPLALTLAHATRDNAVALGGLAGAMGGLAFARDRGLYREAASVRRRRAWLAVGLVGLPVVYLSMRALAPPESLALGRLYLWLRYAAIGLWVSYLVPRLVEATRRPHETSEPGEAPRP